MPWVRPRNVAGASGAVWSAAEILRLAHASPVEVGLFGLAATGLTGWKAGSKPAAIAGTAGAWLTLASAAGPWAGSGLLWHPLTIAWGAGTLAAVWALDKHAAIRAAKSPVVVGADSRALCTRSHRLCASASAWSSCRSSRFCA